VILRHRYYECISLILHHDLATYLSIMTKRTTMKRRLNAVALIEIKEKRVQAVGFRKDREYLVNEHGTWAGFMDPRLSHIT